MTVRTVTHDNESAAISLRSVRPDDRAFLLSVYASTRELEVATVVDWDAAQKAAFVRMQFDAQYAYYQENYEGAAFDVILVGGQPAGRLYIHPRDDEIRIMDIALLPEHRRSGTGTTLSRCRNGPPSITSPTCQRKSDWLGSVIYGIAAETWR